MTNTCKFCNDIIYDIKNTWCSPICKIKDNIHIDSNDCWNWTKYKNKNYGETSWINKKYKVHRLSYESFNNIILSNKQYILHSCDNPPCCNPKHLRIGNQTDNINDAMERNRLSCGEKHYNSKLTDEQVIEIYTTYGSKEYFSNKFNVSESLISLIKNDKRWKNLTKNLIKEPFQKGSLSKDEVICIFYDTTMSYEQLAKKYESSKSVICSIKNKKSYINYVRDL